MAENHIPLNNPERSAAEVAAIEAAADASARVGAPTVGAPVLGAPALNTVGALEPDFEVMTVGQAAAAQHEAAALRTPEAVVLSGYRSPRELRAIRVEAAPEVFDAARGEGAPIIVTPARDVAEGSFGETTLLEAVIGNDDRVKVDDALTQSNPWRQICSLRILAASGSVYVGTGWFIGPKTLATAGHCVFIRNEGGWAVSIDVIPGRHGSVEPYGRATGTRFSAVDGWVKSGRRDFDYGIIHLPDTTLGTKVGNFEVEAFPDADLAGVTSRISGYPADLDHAEYQYYHERPLLTVTRTRLNYDIDTFGGQSGSPIWRQNAGQPPIAIGIHTTGGLTSNSGTRISEHVIENLIRWLGEA